MEDLNADIKKLHETILVLLKQHKQLQKENEHLKTFINNLQDQLKQNDVLLQNRQQKQVVENLVSLQNAEEKVLLQKRIDFYLKDIETCLSLLNA